MKTAKQQLRRSALETIRAIPVPERAAKSGAISSRIIALPEWKDASILLSFLPLPEEVDTEPLMIAALEQGKRVAAPRIGPDDLDFHIVTDLSCAWVIHAYGVREPASGFPLLTVSALAGEHVLALVPGLAFGQDCSRLGRGKGYYDRFLEKAGRFMVSAGVCFSEQLYPEVPSDPLDRPVDMVVTDTGIFYRKPGLL